MLNTPHAGCRPVTSQEADVLAKRIINTWRLTPPLGEWIDALLPFPHDAAATTFVQLRSEVEGGLGIARFEKALRARLASARREREEVHPPPRCELCEGSGAVDATPAEAHNPRTCRGVPGVSRGDGDPPCWCHAVVACACTAGVRLAAMLDRHGMRASR